MFLTFDKKSFFLLIMECWCLYDIPPPLHTYSCAMELTRLQGFTVSAACLYLESAVLMRNSSLWHYPLRSAPIPCLGRLSCTSAVVKVHFCMAMASACTSMTAWVLLNDYGYGLCLATCRHACLPYFPVQRPPIQLLALQPPRLRSNPQNPQTRLPFSILTWLRYKLRPAGWPSA